MVDAIAREEYPHFDEFTGSREALVAAGVVDATKFPGDPGNRKVVQRYLDGERAVAVRKLSKGRFAVARDIPAEEQEARLARFHASMEKRNERYRAAQQAQRDLEHVERVASPDAFRQQFDKFAITLLESIINYATTGDAGYSFSEDSVAEIAEAMAGLSGACQRGRVVFNRAKRAEQITRYRAKIAAGDCEFNDFMGRVTATNSVAGEEG